MKQWFNRHYLGDTPPNTPGAAPLRREDLTGLPRAQVFIAGFDVLKDEGIAYAERLAAAKVDTEVYHFEDLIHGFIQFTGVIEPAADALKHIGVTLGYALTQAGSGYSDHS